MKLNAQNPKITLNKAFLKQRPLRSEIETFKENLKTLLSKVQAKESEENKKNHVRDFLLDTYYKGVYEVNTKDRKDLVIHLDKTNDSNVGVIVEAKSPDNKAEMLKLDKANTKALQELVLYYFDERQTKGNSELKNLVVTNAYEWFIFDANVFDKKIYRNTQIKKLYETYKNDKKDNPFFYEELRKILDNSDEELLCTYFNLKEFETVLYNADLEDDKELIALFKILSPIHLLKLPFADDSNSLNKPFYDELLHIIGLEEVKIKSKSIIRRKEKGNRNQGSLLENAITILETEDVLYKVKDIADYGETKEERYFNIALELCIIWINRILFLKLLESQLVNYHKGNPDYRFLSVKTIPDFDELYRLFHQVLAKRNDERITAIREKYKNVPYLNSSLFEFSELEEQTIKINSLNDRETLPFINITILKRQRAENKLFGTLEYLFRFLDAYDFASEGTEDVQEDNRSLINASVLGKVFEKINGYKDGSIFTPGFITMYMCRQTIRLAVIQKFKDKYNLDIDSFDELKNFTKSTYKTEKIREYNDLINSIHLCDPAVGSGHFLVSSLNEIIAIKSELGLLADQGGVRLSEYQITIENDELIITDEIGDIFEYQINNGKPTAKAQTLQKTLFHEKQTLIENCLFGVDINPNSVKICRLRLWIELLKNAYYKESSGFTELETLPNIDINIKEGNSLIYRFSLDTDLTQILKEIKYNIEDYKNFVLGYKETRDREKKRGFENKIKRIKEDFKTQLFFFSPERRKLADLENQLKASQSKQFLFGETREEKAKRLKNEAALIIKIDKAKAAIKQIEENAVLKNAFEWRFEFPEILDNEGNFLGFDVVIGNPPYGVSIKGDLREKVVEIQGKVPDYEIYYFFTNLSNSILKENGFKSFIIPNSILFNVFAKGYRENLFNIWEIIEILDCTDFNIFVGSATVRNIITLFRKDLSENSKNQVKYRPTANTESFEELIEKEPSITTKEILLENNQNWGLVFKLDSDTLNLVLKIRENKSNLVELFPEISQGLIAYDQYQGQDEETIKSRAYHSFEKRNGLKKWLWGEDVTRYCVNWNGKEYIDYCDGVANPREPKFFKNERILVREITNPSIFAGYIKEEAYNDPAIINILKPKKEKLPLKVLLGLLNSKLATFYHFNSSPKATKGAFPKILVDDIKNFPIPKIEETDQNKFVILVDQILELKKEGKNTQELENKIDRLVNRLYDLTNDEVAIIEGNL